MRGVQAAPLTIAPAIDFAALETVVLQDDRRRQVQIADEFAWPGPVFVNFIFTSCGAVCPVMTAIFAKLDRHLQRQGLDARLYSVSIDPLEDTPDRLRAYAEEHRASTNWRFLTGTPGASEQVQRAFGAWRPDRMSHPVATYLRPAIGAAWLRVDGFASAEELLARLPAAGRDDTGNRSTIKRQGNIS